MTQIEFKAVMAYDPSFAFSGCSNLTCPVNSVSWHEAAAYCNELSKPRGLAPCYSCAGRNDNVLCVEAQAQAGAKIYSCPGYRLPTEAEWEYATRAGSTTAYPNGSNDSNNCMACPEAMLEPIAWYRCNSTTPQPVGKKKSNSWGLVDTAGNVWAWTEDSYQESLGKATVTDPCVAKGQYHVIKGGMFYDFPVNRPPHLF